MQLMNVNTPRIDPSDKGDQPFDIIGSVGGSPDQGSKRGYLYIRQPPDDQDYLRPAHNIPSVMSSAEPTRTTVSIRDLVAFSDAELAQFMEKHRCADGTIELPVDGWDELSKDERIQLAKRLDRAQGQALNQSPTTYSRPLDLDTLDARLRDVSDGNDTPPLGRPEIRERIPETPAWEKAKDKRKEIRAYHNLRKEDAHPLYSIDLLDQVFENPGDYREMIRPWEYRCRRECWDYYWSSRVQPRDLFRRQLARWQDFRKWQKDNRGLEDPGDEFAAYVEARNRSYAEEEWDWRGMMTEQEHDEHVKWAWNEHQVVRQLQRSICRERDCRSFHDYAQAVRERLGRHHFTRSFQLHEDPSKQDKLTTWIEYLNFEYWWLDRYTSKFERSKPAHDKDWQELVDSNVLRPGESSESIRTLECAMQDDSEERMAREAVEWAKSAATNVHTKTRTDSERLLTPEEKRLPMSRPGSAALIAAEKRLEFLIRREVCVRKFVKRTSVYAGAKEDIVSQRHLVQWVLDQIPLIEAEMTHTEGGEVGTGPKLAKRRRSDDESRAHSPKRQKIQHGEQSSRLESSVVLAETTEAGTEDSSVTRRDADQLSRPESLDKMPNQSKDASGEISPEPRRSPRTAARTRSQREPVEQAKAIAESGDRSLVERLKELDWSKLQVREWVTGRKARRKGERESFA
ncbi:hypothetical protein ACRALDRAFT_1092157 [Sodiomyces alcalophilus JCM 7366]|uniref:uncharacterized protein n=1 Tax=Sodiomyces alcalophilus JCM 7366 TaxID=591952 RepID=UPI0039B6AD3A